MSTYIERHFARSRGVDAYNQRTGQRVFFADITEPQAATALVVATEGGIDSPFPGDNGLIVDSISSRIHESGVGCEVTYNYSTDRRFTMPQTVNRDKSGYYTWNSAWATTTKQIPYARQVRKIVGEGGSAVTKDVWELGEADSIQLPIQTVSVNVTLDTWGPDDTDTVNSLIGELHVPGGVGSQFLFDGASVSRRGDGKYDVTYNYRGDCKVKAKPPGDAIFVRPTFDLSPWFDYAIKPSVDPTTTAPTFIPVYRGYVANDNGCLSLPGWPF